MQLSRLKAIRDGQALSMDELSRRSGVSKTTIVRAEKGEPTYTTTVRKLAKALGVAPADLIGAPAAPPVLHGAERRARALAELREDTRRALERGDLAAAARYEAALAAYGESPLR